VISVDTINAMSRADFVATFADIAEHSPWVAGTAERSRPFAGRNAMIRAFEAAVRDAPETRRLALVRAHPDLAGRITLAGALGADSAAEQAGAGLDRLTPAEYARFIELNDAYREKFGFPFIYAVRGADKTMILAAFEERLDNLRAAEFETATEQVCRIIRFRLEDRVMDC
jgi:2-oxo-4-hydroxy-4-carboxy-5-ureidoimidazoline decarboxylase